jgi:hypothetical protein
MRFAGTSIIESDEIPGKKLLQVNVIKRGDKYGLAVSIETEIGDYLKTRPDKQQIVSDIVEVVQRAFNRLLGDA